MANSNDRALEIKMTIINLLCDKNLDDEDLYEIYNYTRVRQDILIREEENNGQFKCKLP